MSSDHNPHDLAAVLDALKAATHALQLLERTVLGLTCATPQDDAHAVSPADASDVHGADGWRTSIVAHSTNAADPTLPSVTQTDLERWLAKRGATLRGHRPTAPADEPLDRVAAQIGERFALLEPLMCAARKAASSGRSRTLHLREHTSDVTGAVSAAATRLHDLGLLSFSRYERSVGQLHLRVADAGAAFLGGGWLERWAAMQASDALAAAGRDGLVLRGVELTLADGQAAEIDVVVLAAGLDPLVVECRTGAYQDRLDRDVRVRRALGLAPEHAVVVLSGAGHTACSELSAIHGLAITTLDGLDDTYGAVFSPLRGPGPEPGLAPASLAAPERRSGRAEGGSPPCDAGVAPTLPAERAPLMIVDRDVQTIRETLRRGGLRPHPRQRRAILAAITTVLQAGPSSAREVKAAAAERAGTSRSAANDILTALARGEGLLRRDGTPVASLGEEIGALASSDPAELEARCRRAWRATLNAQDPTLLATPAGDRCFVAAVEADPS